MYLIEMKIFLLFQNVNGKIVHKTLKYESKSIGVSF